MNRQELDLQADRIEMVAHDHETPVRVTGGNVTPRWIQFLLQPAAGVKVNRVEALSREIAIALGAPTARVTTQGGAVRIDVPRHDPQPVKLLPLCARLPSARIPFGTAVLGIADDGAPLLVRLPSPDVSHVLVAGTTGSGKTALVQSMIVSLALTHQRRQMQFVLIACPAVARPAVTGVSGIDPKGRAFKDLNDLPHLLKPIVAQPDQAAQTLAEMVTLMEAREHKRVTEPRIVIVIDDLADLIQPFDSRSGSGQAVIDSLTRLVQRGHEAGIHVIAATQKPSSSIVGSLVRANFPVRLVGRVVSADDARLAAGIGGTGAERLTAPGDFIAVTGPGVIRFQAAHITALELASVTRQLKEGVHSDEIIGAHHRPAPEVDRGSVSSAAIADAIRALPRMSRA